MKVYLILKAWSDGMENDADNAFGYSEVGYVTDLSTIDFTEEYKNDCWAKPDGFVPLYKHKEIREFKQY